MYLYRGFGELLNSETGKIHTDFFSMGTETGRFSSRNPNLQNLPRRIMTI
ncbi:DNA polymerase [Clostridium perfringens]|nr:DNA polymerase [Clostridium perfringens]